MGAKVSNSFRARYPERLRSLTLGGYGWPWRGERRTLAESRANLEQRDVLPGNDLQALAAVNVGTYELMPSAESLQANQIPTLAIIGTADEVVPASDVETLRATMANLQFTQIPGTHAGPDGAPYKPVFAEKLIDFLDRH
jgi:pimeloyl-ACP methyl ester carboxylesterase